MNQRLSRLLALAASLFTFIAVGILASTNHASGYEWSIYDALPMAFWLLIIVSVFLGLVIVLNHATNRDTNRNWILGMISVLINILVLLVLPQARGYLIFGRYDVLTHIGLTHDILNTGSVGSYNMYPIDHALCAVLHYVSASPLTTLSSFIPAFFSVFYIVAFYVMVRTLSRKKEVVLAALIMASLPFFGNGHFSFAPYNQAILVVPFALYVLLSYQTKETLRLPYLGVMLVIIPFLVFLHPLISIVLMVLFVVVDFSRRRGPSIRVANGRTGARSSLVRMALLTLITFFVWYSYADPIVARTKLAYRWITGDFTGSEADKYVEQIGLANVGAIDLFRSLIDYYGHLLIIMVLAIVFSTVMYLNMRGSTHKHFPTEKCAILGFLVFSMASLVALISVPIVSFGRVLPIAVMFAIVVISIGVVHHSRPEGHSLHHDRRMDLRKTMSLAIILFVVVALTVNNLYPSPKQRIGNQQVTLSEFEGMRYFFEIRDENFATMDLGVGSFRFHDAIYGVEAPKISIDAGQGSRPPDHFGYDTLPIFGLNYGDQRYLILNSYGREYTVQLFPEFDQSWSFDADDFEKLVNDSSISCVFQNGNLQVYLVSPG